MTSASWLVLIAGLLSVVLYTAGAVQIRRAFPDRAGWLIAQCALPAVGAVVGAAISGSDQLLYAAGPAGIAVVGFIAGKGSIPVLLHEGGDTTPMSPATAQARRRFGTIAVVVFVVGFVVFVFLPEQA